VFITCLQRIASIVFSLGVALLLSAAYLRSSVSTHVAVTTQGHQGRLHDLPTANTALYITFPLAALLHALRSVLHAPPVLATIGLHTAAYTSLIAGLGTLFAGLGMWEVLS
jgi:hypothetical protein